MTYVLGIDIGTTYSAAALARHGRAEIAALGAISTAVPTAVYLLPDGGFLTAEEAIRRGAADPDRLVLYFKRRLGDPVPLSVAGESYDPGVLLGEMLSWVRQRAVELEGGPPDEVVVTHPANWGDYKKDLLETAISNAGIYPFSLLTEPEAAAVHYSSQERTEVGSLIAVYDLGGGTFDAALLRKTENRYDFVGEPLGVERLGGIDFDDLIWGHVVTTLGGSLGQIDLENPSNRRAVAALRRSMSEVKESLSSDSQVVVPVVLPGIDTEIRITRVEFEGLIRPFLEDTLLALQHLLDNAGVTTDDVNAVLLVGGSSRIPLVAELVTRIVGRPVALDVHPKFAVAQGAALSAGVEPESVPVPVLPPIPALETSEEPVPKTVVAEEVEPTPTSRRWIFPLVGLILVAAVALYVWQPWSGEETPEPIAADVTVTTAPLTTTEAVTTVPVTTTEAVTTTATPTPASEPVLTASEQVSTAPLALDGKITTHWASGAPPPQWIELDFGGERVVTGVRLVTDQDPPGFTRHIIYGRINGELQVLATLNGDTDTLESLTVKIDPPATVTSIRVETIDSPSWVSWAEIDVVEAE